jgi:hypothetical protein
MKWRGNRSRRGKVNGRSQLLGRSCVNVCSSETSNRRLSPAFGSARSDHHRHARQREWENLAGQSLSRRAKTGQASEAQAQSSGGQAMIGPWPSHRGRDSKIRYQRRARRASGQACRIGALNDDVLAWRATPSHTSSQRPSPAQPAQPQPQSDLFPSPTPAREMAAQEPKLKPAKYPGTSVCNIQKPVM